MHHHLQKYSFINWWYIKW